MGTSLARGTWATCLGGQINKDGDCVLPLQRTFVSLSEDDIPGAKLPREQLKQCNVQELKRWLSCRGACVSGKKPKLIARFVNIDTDERPGQLQKPSLFLIKDARMDWLENLANYKEDYNVSLFHVVCTVTVMIFCSRCDASLVYWQLAHFISKPFVICARSTSYFNRKKENKNI